MTGATSRIVVLVRHGRAESGGEGADHQRPLTPEGRATAAEQGQWLAAEVPAPDEVWVSSAARAVQTWDAMALSVDAPEATVERALYLAGARELIDRITAWRRVEEKKKGKGSTLLVVGHNPTLEEVVTLLTGQVRGLRPGAVAVVDLDEGRVLDLREPRG